jgi:hypothetical protein
VDADGSEGVLGSARTRDFSDDEDSADYGIMSEQVVFGGSSRQIRD